MNKEKLIRNIIILDSSDSQSKHNGYLTGSNGLVANADIVIRYSDDMKSVHIIKHRSDIANTTVDANAFWEKLRNDVEENVTEPV